MICLLRCIRYSSIHPTIMDTRYSLIFEFYNRLFSSLEGIVVYAIEFYKHTVLFYCHRQETHSATQQQKHGNNKISVAIFALSKNVCVKHNVCESKFYVFCCQPISYLVIVSWIRCYLSPSTIIRRPFSHTPTLACKQKTSHSNRLD